LIFVCWFALAGSTTYAQALSFESSDGLWTDDIIPWKGRTFKAVLYTFEAYRHIGNHPKVSLVRTTPLPFWSFLVHDVPPEWKVPYSPSSGHAKVWHGPPLYQDEIREIKRKAEEDYDYWQKKH
jgi:hypothetical protein